MQGSCKGQLMPRLDCKISAVGKGQSVKDGFTGGGIYGVVSEDKLGRGAGARYCYFFGMLPFGKGCGNAYPVYHRKAAAVYGESIHSIGKASRGSLKRKAVSGCPVCYIKNRYIFCCVKGLRKVSNLNSGINEAVVRQMLLSAFLLGILSQKCLLVSYGNRAFYGCAVKVNIRVSRNVVYIHRPDCAAVEVNGDRLNSSRYIAAGHNFIYRTAGDGYNGGFCPVIVKVGA